jgi:S-adenosylmethionine-diacylglycerol 3-amino-3-carboxypropyl transferase
MEPGSVDRVVLLDAPDWMDDQTLNELWDAITRTAAPNAKVIFRTAGIESILPGRVKNSTLSKWAYQADQSKDYTKKDRSAIYGGFHLYNFIG